jgi:pyrimidine deaminase RibD-like protein
MDDELKQKIADYADKAYAAANHNSLQQTKLKIAGAKNQLASRGLILSSETIRQIASLQGEHINTVVQAKADALLDAYELYGAEVDDSILKDATALRQTLVNNISADSASGLPPGVPASGMFRTFLETNTGAIINMIACQIEQRKMKPKFAREENRDEADEDRRFALMAIEEARKSIPEDDRPHPKVGAVVVKNGVVVSKAHRGENPKPKSHAEYIALEEKLSDDLVAGATVYTTLEPCTTRNHPKIPCAQRLVERKVARVVIGMLDPNPEIRGLGEQLLSEAGIETQLFPKELKDQVAEINREFMRAQKQRLTTQKASEEKAAPTADPKVEAILSYKGKVVTVFNRQKYGNGYLEGYWPNGATIVDCNGLWVDLEDSSRARLSFSLTKVTVGFDNQHNRLQLDLER